jgi:DNA-binding NtrC family response regulator
MPEQADVPSHTSAVLDQAEAEPGVDPASTREPVPNDDSAILPLNELEKRAIISALKATGGNRTRTAELLNISIRTLRNKLQEYRASGDYGEANGAGKD